MNSLLLYQWLNFRKYVPASRCRFMLISKQNELVAYIEIFDPDLARADPPGQTPDLSSVKNIQRVHLSSSNVMGDVNIRTR